MNKPAEAKLKIHNPTVSLTANKEEEDAAKDILNKSAKLLQEAEKRITDTKKLLSSDGSSADYYKLPRRATQLQDLIAFRNMNAQMGEIFRATYRYGACKHSPKERDLRKIIFYAKAELNRLKKYGEYTMEQMEQMEQMNKSTDTVVAEGICVQETEKAVLIESYCAEDKVWIPKSQFRRELEITDPETQSCLIFIPRWLADSTKLDYDELLEEEGQSSL